MKFDLSKHELFRFAIPGAIFLLTIGSFFVIKEPIAGKSIELRSLNVLFGLALTFPLGYLVHNAYMAFHVIFEQYSWYRFENLRLWQILNGVDSLVVKVKKIDNGCVFEKNRKSRLGSWFIESCLHMSGSEPIKERLYELISRIHSKGASMAAVCLALPLSFYFFQLDISLNHVRFFTWIWCFVVFCLGISRWTSIQGCRALIEHFLRIRRKLIIDVAMGSDPFLCNVMNDRKGQIAQDCNRNKN